MIAMCEYRDGFYHYYEFNEDGFCIRYYKSLVRL